MVNPLARDHWVLTSDSESFRYLKGGVIGVPAGGHPGAYLHQRKNHKHEGIDLYGVEGEPVYSIEDGIVMDVIDFTGERANSPWWTDTKAVIVKCENHYILYGEVTSFVQVGQKLQAGDLLGTLKTVLKEDKGRPMCMLHLEKYSLDWNMKPWIGQGPFSHPHSVNPTSLIRLTPVKQHALVVAGTFDEEGGKRSGYVDKALKAYYERAAINAHLMVINGGDMESLKWLVNIMDAFDFDKILWWPNVDNKHEKLVGKIKHDGLVISKNNRDLSYTELMLHDRMANAGAVKLVEFYKTPDGFVWQRVHVAGEDNYIYWQPSLDCLIKEVLS